MPEQPPLTWQHLTRMASGTKLEVYVRGTGLWVEARVWQGPSATCVEPVSLEGEEYEVVIRDEYAPEHKEYLAGLVRRPLPKGYDVPPGPYRGLLEQMSSGLIDIMRQAADTDESAACLSEVKKVFRHMLTSGGFRADLWQVFTEVARLNFVLVAGQDDVLKAILDDIRKGEKS